jgi:hypothetical protein
MKKIIYLFCILLCSSSFVWLQGQDARLRRNKTVENKTTNPEFSEAEKGWIPFWNNFTKAIKNRDRRSLKEMISKDYTCYSNVGECSCENFADKREIAFCGYEDFWHVITPSNSKIRFGKAQKLEGKIIKSVEQSVGDFTRYYTFSFEENDWHLNTYGIEGL